MKSSVLLLCWGLTASQDSTASPAAIPAFIKQHKVGGTTVATLLDCVAKRNSELRETLLGWGHHGSPQKLCSNKISPDGAKGWHGPWGHITLAEYSKSGLLYFSSCAVGLPPKGLMSPPPHRIFTVLRHPVERLVSAMSFFSHVKVRHAFVDPIFKDPKAQSGATIQHAILAVANISFPKAGGVHQAMDLLLSNSGQGANVVVRGKDSTDPKSRPISVEIKRLAFEATYQDTKARAIETANRFLQGILEAEDEQHSKSGAETSPRRILSAAGMETLDSSPEVKNLLLRLGFVVATVEDEAGKQRSTLKLPSNLAASALAKPAAVLSTALSQERSKPDPYVRESKAYINPQYTKAQTAHAVSELRTNFVVGVTERMDQFLVLMSLELKWPEDHLCKPVEARRVSRVKSHGNSSSGQRYRNLLDEDAVAFLEEWLAADVQLYNAAVTLAIEQESFHGGAFTMRFERYKSSSFAASCELLRSSGTLGVVGETCAYPARTAKQKQSTKEPPE